MHRNQSQRRGFTLIELLVVIAIIAILAALGTVAVFAMMGVRQRNNSIATVRVVHKLRESRWSDVIADAKKESPSTYVKNLAGGDGQRAQVIWIKVRLMEAFPQRYSDVNNPVVLTTLINDRKFKPHFAKYQKELQGKSGGGAGESSACLLLALKTLGADGMVAVQDQLGYAVYDSDGDGVPELIDSFSNPLVFIRFGQGPNIQAANPAAAGSKGQKFCDTVDSGGLLLTPAWYASALRGNPPNPNSFEALIHNVSPDNGATAYFTIPIVLSAGKDGQLNTADDITSYTLVGD